MLATGPNHLVQPCPRSHQVRLLVAGRIHLLCGFTVQHAQYGEIERGGGLSEGNFQMAVVEGGKGSPRRPLQRLDVFKASGTETNLLGNQHDAYSDSKIGYEEEMKTEIFGVCQYQKVD